MTLPEFAAFVCKKLKANGVRYAGKGGTIRRVAVGGGSCGDSQDAAIAVGCDAFVTSDLGYHEFLDAAGTDKAVNRPKKTKPLLSVEKVVRGCLRASEKGRTMYVTNWYTKMQHVLFKLLPDRILTTLWMGMQIEADTEKVSENENKD